MMKIKKYELILMLQSFFHKNCKQNNKQKGNYQLVIKIKLKQKCKQQAKDCFEKSKTHEYKKNNKHSRRCALETCARFKLQAAIATAFPSAQSLETPKRQCENVQLVAAQSCILRRVQS